MTAHPIHDGPRPMPSDRIRQALGYRPKHPALTATCPRCGAAAGQPCHTQARERRMPQPHPARISTWATRTAACPVCGAARGERCQANGWPLHDHAVHQQRHDAAQKAA
jgi:hypothetical protein